MDSPATTSYDARYVSTRSASGLTLLATDSQAGNEELINRTTFVAIDAFKNRIDVTNFATSDQYANITLPIRGDRHNTSRVKTAAKLRHKRQTLESPKDRCSQVSVIDDYSYKITNATISLVLLTTFY